jgi:hypothetical protein
MLHEWDPAGNSCPEPLFLPAKVRCRVDENIMSYLMFGMAVPSTTGPRSFARPGNRKISRPQPIVSMRRDVPSHTRVQTRSCSCGHGLQCPAGPCRAPGAKWIRQYGGTDRPRGEILGEFVRGEVRDQSSQRSRKGTERARASSALSAVLYLQPNTVRSSRSSQDECDVTQSSLPLCRRGTNPSS